jgi:hypothetical protein
MQSTTLVAPKVSRGVGTAATQIGGYSPASSAIVAGIIVANTSGAGVSVTVTVFDGANDTNLAFATPVAVGDSLVLGGENFKLVIVAGWSVRVKSSAAASVDATMSVAEFT